MDARTVHSIIQLKLQVKELREELDRRKADSRGTKVLLVDRLFNLMQEESKQLATAKSDAARAPPHAPQTRYCTLMLDQAESPLLSTIS